MSGYFSAMRRAFSKSGPEASSPVTSRAPSGFTSGAKKTRVPSSAPGQTPAASSPAKRSSSGAVIHSLAWCAAVKSSLRLPRPSAKKRSAAPATLRP